MELYMWASSDKVLLFKSRFERIRVGPVPSSPLHCSIFQRCRLPCTFEIVFSYMAVMSKCETQCLLTFLYLLELLQLPLFDVIEVHTPLSGFLFHTVRLLYDLSPLGDGWELALLHLLLDCLWVAQCFLETLFFFLLLFDECLLLHPVWRKVVGKQKWEKGFSSSLQMVWIRETMPGDRFEWYSCPQFLTLAPSQTQPSLCQPRWIGGSLCAEPAPCERPAASLAPELSWQQAPSLFSSILSLWLLDFSEPGVHPFKCTNAQNQDTQKFFYPSKLFWV